MYVIAVLSVCIFPGFSSRAVDHDVTWPHQWFSDYDGEGGKKPTKKQRNFM